jgi:pyrroline-5-carboxylate reductase
VAVVEPTFTNGAHPFKDRSEVTVYASADDLPNTFQPEVVVLAVKPQQIPDALPAYVRFATAETVFLSIAAGTEIAYFERHFGRDVVIVRAMPNLPASIRLGISVACPNSNVSAGQLDACEGLLSAVGEVCIVEDEGLLDAVTAVSGSGPAYVFLLIECLVKAGEAAGLPTELAARLALVTVAGSGQLAIMSDDPPGQLRRDVTSPAGTTEAAIKVLMAQNGLEALIIQAVEAATNRSRELAK